MRYLRRLKHEPFFPRSAEWDYPIYVDIVREEYVIKSTRYDEILARKVITTDDRNEFYKQIDLLIEEARLAELDAQTRYKKKQRLENITDESDVIELWDEE